MILCFFFNVHFHMYIYIYIHIHIFIYLTHWSIDLVGRVFINGLEDQDSIPSQVIPRFKKWYLMLNTQHYKVHIKNKVKQSRERSCALPYNLVLWLLKREPLVTLDYSYQLLVKLILIQRCFWCNALYHRKWTSWCMFKSWTRLFSFPLELISPSSYG